jgi:hypothetical protein
MGSYRRGSGRRIVEDERTPCVTLDLHLLVARVWDLPRALRLAHDPEGRELVLTDSERRDAAAAERDAAQARVAELEKQLRERG